VISSENSGNYTRAIFHISDVQDNPSAAGRPTFEIEIIEEDGRNLPKRLLQVHKKYITTLKISYHSIENMISV
jgi:hypothetical protein